MTGSACSNNVPASRRLYCVTGSEKSPPGGETAAMIETEPSRGSVPSDRVALARS